MFYRVLNTNLQFHYFKTRDIFTSKWDGDTSSILQFMLQSCLQSMNIEHKYEK